MTQTEPTAPEIRIRVDYDFASSLCYVAQRVMQRMEPVLSADNLILEWSPIDLSRITGWPRGVLVDETRRANIARVASDLEVSLRIPTLWLDSRPLHAAVLSLPPAQQPLWRERVWTALYEEGMLPDGDDVDRLAQSVGLLLEPDAMEQGLATLDELTQAAREQGVSGVPNFMLGEWPFGGIQTEDTMHKTFARFAQKQRAGELPK